jgi:putative hemolysin
MNTPFLLTVIIAAAAGFSFFLSGMEAGVFSLNRLRIRQLARRGRPAAQLLHRYLDKSENFLWTILVGNTLASFVVVWLGVVVLRGWLHEDPWLFLVAWTLCVFLFYASCDLLPKMLFRMFPNRLCLALVYPFRLVHGVLSPGVALVTRLAEGLLRWTAGRIFTGTLFANRDELRQVMQESAQGFTSEERGMINRVLDSQNLTVRQIAVPLARAVTVSTTTPMSEVLELCRGRNLTRIPVWQDDGARRRIAGLVSLKSLLYQGDLDLTRTAGDYMKPALFVPEGARLEEVLGRMQRSGQRLAIVLAHDHAELGIVCLEDVLRAMIGEVKL